MPKYVSRYKRRSSRNIRRSKSIPLILAIIGAVILVVALIVLGATLLGLKLRDEAARLDEAPEIEYKKPEIQIREPMGDVREVNGYIYSFDKFASDYIGKGILDLSVMLRASNGYLVYNSEVAASVGWDAYKESVDLKEEVSAIQRLGGYICGYMYISSFSDESSLAEMRQAYEKSLVVEAAKSGINEILLLGIDVEADNLDAVLLFLSEIKAQAGNVKIGIELEYDEVVSDNINTYVAQRMLRVCDFVSLDASTVPCAENGEKLGFDNPESYDDFKTAVEEIYYYLSKMQVRLTFNKDEVEMYRSISDCTYVNRQMHE